MTNTNHTTVRNAYPRAILMDALSDPAKQLDQANVLVDWMRNKQLEGTQSDNSCDYVLRLLATDADGKTVMLGQSPTLHGQAVDTTNPQSLLEAMPLAQMQDIQKQLMDEAESTSLHKTHSNLVVEVVFFTHVVPTEAAVDSWRSGRQTVEAPKTAPTPNPK